MSKSPNFGDIPFRIRLAHLGEISDVGEDRLRDEVVQLFDYDSQKLLREATHTSLEFDYEQLSPDNLDTVDVVVVNDASSPATEDLLKRARAQSRPIITVTTSETTALSIERGQGLSAQPVTALDRFNAYSISTLELESYQENVYNSILRSEDGIPSDVKQTIRQQLLPYYVRASLLAKANQKTYKRAGLLVYSFSALAVGAVAIGTLIHELSALAFSVELLLLLTILITIVRANHKRSHKNWIQARYLAERIRAAVFLTACGIETPAIALPANVGVTGRPDQWMSMAFNEIMRRLPHLRSCHQMSCGKFVEFARRKWLADQIEFHKNKAAKARKMNHLLERVGIALFSGALLAAGLHLLFFALHLERLELPLTFAAIFLPAAGAAIGGIRSHREYSRLAMRSSNMAESLKALDDRLALASTPEELRSVLLQVEDLILLELQDWLVLMSVAKLEAA